MSKKFKKKILNHDRNRHIKFTESDHTYWYYETGDKRTTPEQFFGVTGLMKEFKKPFDPNQHIKSSKNPRSEWYGMDPDDIKQAWLDKRDYGSDGHKAIENSINDGVYDDEWAQYIDSAWELLDKEGITPVVSEWVIYDETIKRASAIDICGEKDNKLVPVDMKFFADGMKFNPYGTYNFPLQDIPNSKFDSVSLQLSIYASMLQSNYSDVPLSDERYVLLFSDEGVELLPTINYDDYVTELYKFQLKEAQVA